MVLVVHSICDIVVVYFQSVTFLLFVFLENTKNQLCYIKKSEYDCIQSI